MKRPRWNHSASVTATATLAASRSEKALFEPAEQYKVHPNQIGQWRLELLEHAAEAFATAACTCGAGPDVKTLHAMIGRLAFRRMLRPCRSNVDAALPRIVRARPQ